MLPVYLLVSGTAYIGRANAMKAFDFLLVLVVDITS